MELHPATTDRPIRVVIADDHTLFAEALALALRSDPRFEVLALAENGQKALDLAASLDPDVVLMDVRMPVMDGIEATRRLRLASPRSRVVAVTASTSPEDGARARAAGARACIRKWASSDELRRAVVEASAEADSSRKRWAVSPRILRTA